MKSKLDLDLNTSSAPLAECHQENFNQILPLSQPSQIICRAQYNIKMWGHDSKNGKTLPLKVKKKGFFSLYFCPNLDLTWCFYLLLNIPIFEISIFKLLAWIIPFFMLYNMEAPNSFGITEIAQVVFPSLYVLMDSVLNKTMEIPHKTISVFHYTFSVHTNSTNFLYLHLQMVKKDWQLKKYRLPCLSLYFCVTVFKQMIGYYRELTWEKKIYVRVPWLFMVF